ncbi:MAG: CocE/NonD family hydrolase [Trueperaceae bacterium]|nr:CocE/NonD family hydrolase [Trueperaceae bacterium]
MCPDGDTPVPDPTMPAGEGAGSGAPPDEGEAALEGVRLRRHVRIPMRDGVHLSADLYMPEAEGRYPVVLEYLPYRKDDRSHARQNLQAELARRGYVGCRLDVRGTGSSEDVLNDEYTVTEQLDGCDAIAWLAAQPWCNGNVGMWGISYGGFNALQVAMHRPPALKAIVPVMFTDDRYEEECHFKGGSVRGLYTWSDYPLMMVALNALPPHPDAVEGPWLETWRARLERQEPWVLPWLEHQTDGAYWANGSLNRDYGAIECATFLIGGWRDGYPNAPLRTYEHLEAPKKAWVGPWTHTLPHESFPGPQADFFEEAVRFYDHWLKGVDNGVMDEPPLRVYVQEHGPPSAIPGDWPGRWRGDASLPADPAGFELHLDDGGRLAPEPVAREGIDAFAYDPTVGTTGGIWCWATPVAQGDDDGRSVTYDAAALEAPLEIIGRGFVEVGFASDAEVAGLAVRLEDVDPYGTSVLVSKGYLNATRRDSMSDPEALTPGRVYRLRVPLDATAWRFRAGHRIRLAFAGADWPNVWPTPYPARHQLHWGGPQGAKVWLPRVRDGGETLQVARPEALTPVVESKAGADAWRVTRDRLDDASIVEVAKEQGLSSLIRETVLRLSKEVEGRVAPDDPAGARVRGSNTIVLNDFGHEIRTVARADMRGDTRAFHVGIELEVTLNGRPFFTRRWDRSIPRTLM